MKAHDLFYLAGIWQPWTDKETGEKITTFALATAKANALIAQMYNKRKRMPVVLTEGLRQEWLQKDRDEKRIQQIATFQLPAEDMQAWTIRKDFRERTKPQEHFYYGKLPGVTL